MRQRTDWLGHCQKIYSKTYGVQASSTISFSAAVTLPSDIAPLHVNNGTGSGIKKLRDMFYKTDDSKCWNQGSPTKRP